MPLIQLTQGKVTLVSDEIYNYFNKWEWYANKNYNMYYAVRQEKGIKLFLHREIMYYHGDDIFNKLVDHKDRNGLNNLEENLRITTYSKNRINSCISRNNTSGYRGVTYCKKHQKWQASITINHKIIWLGYFDNVMLAAYAYDEAARKYHEEPQLNFPD